MNSNDVLVFTEALNELKKGKKVSRWEWGEIYLILVNEEDWKTTEGWLAKHGLIGKKHEKFIMCCDRYIMQPWAPKNTDLFAEDWYIFE
jgi:Protein of unknown function (DUF2829)